MFMTPVLVSWTSAFSNLVDSEFRAGESIFVASCPASPEEGRGYPGVEGPCLPSSLRKYFLSLLEYIGARVGVRGMEGWRAQIEVRGEQEERDGWREEGSSTCVVNFNLLL